jgi:uncharacterized protein YbaP (TraB family)
MHKKIILFPIVFLIVLSAIAQGKYPSVLWEIKKTSASRPSYLFGTYHISDKGVFKMGDSIFYALKNVDMVATEVNDNTWQHDNAMLDSMKNSYSFYSDYFNGSYVNEGLLRKTNSIQKLPTFISFQPASINYFLYRNTDLGEGFEEEAFLDRFISSAGYKGGKKIAGLENIIESEIKQIEGEKDEALLEKQENKELPEGLSESEINDLIFDGYKNNNLDMMDSLDKYNYTSEAYYKKFLIARNYDQADSLDYYIKQGNAVFAAVGAAHLPGYEGVIEIMRKKGYKMRPVKLTGHDKASIEAIKKKTIPVMLQPAEQHIDGGITFRAPGKFNHHFTNALLRIYAYVDMANGAYYMISRMFNNSFFFGFNQNQVINAIDSLLYENVKGDIITKNKFSYKGYPALDVISQLKNKDLEKYRFIVTPYEILKIKAGGKNDYASLPVVDSFFNSFSIRDETAIDARTGVNISLNPGNWHTWYSEYFSQATNKIRFSNYDKSKDAMNGCIKISIAEKNLHPDEDYYKMAAESFTSSFALKKDEYKNLDVSRGVGSQIQFFKMETGGIVAVKTIIRQPFLYVIFAASHKEKPDTNWISQVKFNPVIPESTFPFVDSMRGFSCMLPYKLNFDSKWKAASERKTEKPDPDKKLNRNEALYYYGENIYFGKNWNLFTFQHPLSLDIIWGASAPLDSSQSYPDAGSFWKNFIPRPYDSHYYNKEILSGSSASEFDSDDDYPRGYRLHKSTEFVSKLVYDTASSIKQQVSYITADSLSSKAVYTTAILYQDKVYEFQTVVAAPDYILSPFFKSFIESFRPLSNNPTINVYSKKLVGIVNEYTRAPMTKKPDISERINKLNFNTSSFPEIEAAMLLLKEHKAENNILRKKIVEALCESDDNKNDWPIISAWLKKIYNDKNELLTIRFFAASKILKNNDERDLAWVLENAGSNPDFRSSYLRPGLLSYFKEINDKEKSRTALTLSSFGTGIKIYFPAIALYDSGYFNTGEMKATFDEINKLVADENSSIRLQAEGDFFKYPEKSEKKKLSDLKYADNFQFYTSMFSLFYSALPTDSFFTMAFEKIFKDGTPKDKLELIKVFAKCKTTPVEWTKKMLESLSDEKSFYLDIFKTFLYYKKLNLLPEKIKNRVDIALSFLQQKDNYYSEHDTLYFFGSKPSPYIKGETYYFFKYRNEKEKNEQIAYVILPENLSYLLTRKKIKHKFTNEQVGADESFQTISDKLMRRQYIGMLYDEDGSADYYLEEKDEKSLDIDE